MSNPPYKAGTGAAQFTLSSSAKYVRVFDDNNSVKNGCWVMRYEDVQGLTAQLIKDKFALPPLPTHICDVNVPVGTKLHTGIAGPVNGWGNEGGLLYDIIYNGYMGVVIGC